MRILVAGGAGYVGSMLVPALLAQGHEVEVLDLFWFGDHLPPHCQRYNRNIFSLKLGDLDGYFDQVIFLAGNSSDPMAEFSPATTFVNNAAAAAYLCYLAKRAGAKRFIYASSCSVYGFTHNQFSAEDAPTPTQYPYGMSKLYGEQAVMQMQSPDFSVIALRKGTISGYSPRMRLDLIVNTMYRSARRDGVIKVMHKDIWRPILGMHDAVRAYLHALYAPREVSGVFNIASMNCTVGQVADAVSEATGADVIYLDKPDVRNYAVSTAKAREVLEFEAQDSLDSIIADLKANEGNFCDWDNPNYLNIKVFENLPPNFLDF